MIYLRPWSSYKIKQSFKIFIPLLTFRNMPIKTYMKIWSWIYEWYLYSIFISKTMQPHNHHKIWHIWLALFIFMYCLRGGLDPLRVISLQADFDFPGWPLGKKMFSRRWLRNIPSGSAPEDSSAVRNLGICWAYAWKKLKLVNDYWFWDIGMRNIFLKLKLIVANLEHTVKMMR